MSLITVSPKASHPPWLVISLVSHHLDPKTLAIASCVSKSWSITMSSDHLWQPIVATHFPSLTNLRDATTTTIPYRHLFSLGHKSTQLRLRSPKKPQLSLDNLTFAVDIHHLKSPPVTLVIPGEKLVDTTDLFRFEVDACNSTCAKDEKQQQLELLFNTAGELKVTLNVVLKGLGGVFTVMDCKGEGRFVSDNDVWFSQELPMPGCCASGVTSGLVMEFRLRFNKEKEVEKVGLRVMSIISWRYVCVDDVLRYLQHFLTLPCDHQMM